MWALIVHKLCCDHIGFGCDRINSSALITKCSVYVYKLLHGFVLRYLSKRTVLKTVVREREREKVHKSHELVRDLNIVQREETDEEMVVVLSLYSPR